MEGSAGRWGARAMEWALNISGCVKSRSSSVVGGGAVDNKVGRYTRTMEWALNISGRVMRSRRLTRQALCKPERGCMPRPCHQHTLA